MQSKQDGGFVLRGCGLFKINVNNDDHDDVDNDNDAIDDGSTTAAVLGNYGDCSSAACPEERDCRTISGEKPGEACVFPFRYEVRIFFIL